MLALRRSTKVVCLRARIPHVNAISILRTWPSNPGFVVARSRRQAQLSDWLLQMLGLHTFCSGDCTSGSFWSGVELSRACPWTPWSSPQRSTKRTRATNTSRFSTRLLHLYYSIIMTFWKTHKGEMGNIERFHAAAGIPASSASAFPSLRMDVCRAAPTLRGHPPRLGPSFLLAPE